MGGSDNFYRMMILLEESMEQESDVNDKQEDKDKEPKKMHEFVEELVLPFQVDELDALNEWFDKFDEQICIPNEGHIKYEITSDGIIILILDKELEPLVKKVNSFVEENRLDWTQEELKSKYLGSQVKWRWNRQDAVYREIR